MTCCIIKHNNTTYEWLAAKLVCQKKTLAFLVSNDVNFKFMNFATNLYWFQFWYPT